MDEPVQKPTLEKSETIKAFLIHLAIFIVVNLLLLVVPVFYDGKVDWSFQERGYMFYGSIGWGIGLLIHGLVVLADRIFNKEKK